LLCVFEVRLTVTKLVSSVEARLLKLENSGMTIRRAHRTIPEEQNAKAQRKIQS
jgi:hypothetical protein